jgi:hypothetical protein
MSGQWLRHTLLILAGSLFAFAGCAGRSARDDADGAGAQGGTQTGGSGTGGSGGAVGAAPSTGGVAGTAPDPDDCLVDGQLVPNGKRWPGDCGECWCDSSKVVCTTPVCTGGAGGGAGTGGASAGSGAFGGEAGEPGCSSYAEIGSFCVLGNPINSGDQLVEGMPLRISLQPSGCHSSSCTTVVSSVCSYLASGGDIMVSPFLCLREEGDACTDDCGGGRSACNVGLALTAGTNRVSIAGTTLEVTFDVPSVAEPGALCSDPMNR